MPSPSTKKEPILEFDHVCFSYPKTPVLCDVNLIVYPGESIGIIGPNGGGKTTLLKLILGFLKPSNGRIKLFGHETTLSSTHLNCVAYVPQSVRFDRDFPISVEEVVLGGLISHLPWHGHFDYSSRQAAKNALEKMGLSSLINAQFGTLSGGQAQRVLIARALVSKPKLLLLDEPTASVDNRSEEDIYTLLNSLKHHMTILMVTHDLSVAAKQVDRLLCVQGTVAPLNPQEVCYHLSMGLYTHLPAQQR